MPVLSQLGETWLIPAHAGKTRRRRRARQLSRAHPRSRGENGKASAVDLSAMGSSPLTRGKPGTWTGAGPSTGLIPAHAGKTFGALLRPFPRRAHPRSRGENIGRDGVSDVKRGSSPLTRGKRDRRRYRDRSPRLIPAHAGKTPPTACQALGIRAHPRSRGENRLRRSLGASRTGSSPLTRGKRISHEHVQIRRGLIPAHAGKTLPDLRFYRADRSDLGKP